MRVAAPSRLALVLFGIAALLAAVGLASSRLLPERESNTTAPEYGAVNLQSDVERVVARYEPITASIVVSKDVPVIQRCSGPALPFPQSPFGGLSRRCVVENETRQVGGGTGFVVSPDGVLLTNKHVVADQSAEYTVLFNDGSQEKVTRMYRDEQTDVALLKVNRAGLVAAELGDSDDLAIGQFVVAIGNALAEFHNSASFGIVSGLGRSVAAGTQRGGVTERLERVIQTDAAINFGNSGGPLINLDGEVVGVNTAVAQDAQNIGFALAINDLKPIIDQFK